MSLACFKKVWNFLTNKNVYFLIRTTYKASYRLRCNFKICIQKYYMFIFK